MKQYLYDGTFEGLMTVFNLVIDNDGDIDSISDNESYQPDLFSEVIEVNTDSPLAVHFFKLLSRKYTQPVLTDIVYCFLSEKTGIEMELLDYIRLLRDHGLKISGQYSNPAVLNIRQTSDKVAHEIHRMHGFVRFRKLKSEVYYAPIEPDFNILQFLAPHFKTRFADQQWVIHDLKRRSALYYDGRTCKFLTQLEIDSEITGTQPPDTSPKLSGVFEADEGDYQLLWDQYFQKIATTERENRKLQRQRMPARYWRHLVERVDK